jgi:hypothetical protein
MTLRAKVVLSGAGALEMLRVEELEDDATELGELEEDEEGTRAGALDVLLFMRERMRSRKLPRLERSRDVLGVVEAKRMEG